ncbi:MAG: DUF6599 family protein [Bryobacteraceae bacterium]|jgi:hypothetical protein
MKLFLAALLLPALAGAAMWPEVVGPYHRTVVAPANPGDLALWDEYGLKSSETAVYENAGKRFTASAYQLQDSTGALAAFEWQRNPNAAPSKTGALAAETPDSLLLAHGNYLLSFSGYKPAPTELDAVVNGLPNVDTTSLPALPGYFPAANRVPNSERYIAGPVSLQRFDPGIPPSVAAFHLGAEAQYGVIHSPKGDMAMAIFNYPTNQIAMQQNGDLARLPGAVTKRSGPLVAVILSPADPDEAERLLAQVRYRASVTLDERVPSARDNIGNLIVNIFTLIGILVAFSIVTGLFAGGARRLWSLGRKGPEAEPMIVLHLENR